MNRRAVIDFLLTLVLLGAAFVLAVASTALAGVDALLAVAAAVGALLLALGGGLYIVPRLAKRVSWEFANYATRTAVTSEGLVFMSIVLIVGVAAWNTENNLLYLILAAMLAFIMASGTISRWMVRDLVVRLRFPDYLFAGEPARLAITLVNRKPLIPSCSITVEAHIMREHDERAWFREPAAATAGRRKRRKRAPKPPKPATLAHFIVVPGKSETRQVIEHTFDKRGRYRVDGFNLLTRFPSGFFRKWRRVDANGEIVVFPQVRPVDDFFHTLPILAGSAESLARGEGVDLYGLRDYRITDHLRRIDWKASARARRVMVRETLHEEDRRLLIYFDPTAPAVDGPEAAGAFEERFESAVEAAASLAHDFVLEEHAEVGFVAPGVRVPVGSGRAHLYRILSEISVLEPAPPPEEAPRDLAERFPGLADEHTFKVFFTSGPKGMLPARIWRTSHVVYVEDMPVYRERTVEVAGRGRR
jgi:uncharacterized protein (DUF58 family)